MQAKVNETLDWAVSWNQDALCSIGTTTASPLKETPIGSFRRMLPPVLLPMDGTLRVSQTPTTLNGSSRP